MHAVSRRKWISRLGALGVTVGLALGGFFSDSAHAQHPIKIGLSIAQTGPLSSGGKSGLVALEIWRDDVNARGGLLGRPVELVVYDDQGNPSMTPGFYT
jgi:branched-chain amino acid transport system substrate-binding protein